MYGRCVADIDELARRFRAAADDHTTRSPFYSALNRSIADHPGVLDLLTAATDEQQLPVLLLAAVHSLLLAEPDLELAAWYPTTSSDPRSTDPFPALARLCDDRADEIREIIATRSVQTNEVGRCAFLLPALGPIEAEVGPLALVDVGTSAGLNLQLDRFEYHYSPGGRVGEPSPVTLECGIRGEIPIPDRLPEISARIGIDRSPVDVSDPDQARWLLACVWPDQADRFRRLAAAIEIAADHPVAIRTGDAVADVGTAVAEVAAVGHPVVLNSWVLNYLPEPRRRAYVAELEAVGRTTDLTWIAAEAPALCAGLPYPPHLHDSDLTAVLVVRWRDGVRTAVHVATAHPHGYWMHAPT